MSSQIVAQCGFISLLANGQIVNNTHLIEEPVRTTKHVTFAKRTFEPAVRAVETSVTIATIKPISQGITLIKKTQPAEQDSFSTHMSLLGVCAL